MTYIQDKLDSINIFDYIVFEDGDIDTEKSEEKIKELLTDYHNHIVEKIKGSHPLIPKLDEYLAIVKSGNMDNMFDYGIEAERNVVLSLLQDTNPKE